MTTPAPSGVLERVAELLDRAAKAEAFNAAHRVGCCEAGYRLPGRNKPCIECGATVAGPCLKAYDKPPAEYRRAVLRDALPLIRDLASALAEARAATLEEAAKVCEAMRPHGGRAWSEGQEACYAALSDAAKNIRALSTGARA